MSGKSPERVIRAETIVDASRDQVWGAWTTEKSIKSFLAPSCNIDLRVNGSYEVFFDLEAEPGRRGGEGVRILALEPKRMLSITWNAPPHLSEVRKQWTHVIVRFEEIQKGQTKVTLTHDGWGEGKERTKKSWFFPRATLECSSVASHKGRFARRSRPG